jgi:hypothetical protein
LTRAFKPIAIGSSAEWCTLAGMIIRPRATSPRISSAGSSSRGPPEPSRARRCPDGRDPSGSGTRCRTRTCCAAPCTSSLRWYEPDQVQRVGARKRPLSPCHRDPPDMRSDNPTDPRNSLSSFGSIATGNARCSQGVGEASSDTSSPDTTLTPPPPRPFLLCARQARRPRPATPGALGKAPVVLVTALRASRSRRGFPPQRGSRSAQRGAAEYPAARQLAILAGGVSGVRQIPPIWRP